MNPILAANIKLERKRLGWTQQRLARAVREGLGLTAYPTRAAVSNWEMARVSVPAEIVLCLAKLFKVSSDYLLGLRTKAAGNDGATGPVDLLAAERPVDRHAATRRLRVAGRRTAPARKDR